MKTFHLFLPALSLLFFLPTRWIHGEGEHQHFECARAAAVVPGAQPGTQSSARQYAPSRQIDLLHLSLDVVPDFKLRTVSGQATVQFKPIAQPLPELKLDGVDLLVYRVTSTQPILAWQATAEQIIVTFVDPIPPDQETTVTVTYKAIPTKGLYFRTPEMGYRPGDMHLWTQGEPLEARHWFPSFDAPNEHFTSEITCHVPEGMTVISNGRLVSKTADPNTGEVAVRWLQDKPHVNYLIALCAGYFKKIEDQHRDIPLAFYTPPSQIGQAANSFRDTKDMMAFFETEIGVPYPWAKYDQVVVDDFNWGGMENTTITILTDRTLFTDATENLRESTGLVAHELAHQWFGDLVTCKDWSHLWLNEGFATFYEALYQQHKYGRDMFLYIMGQRAEGIFAQRNDTNAIVRRDYRQPEDQFGFRAYPKGSWILQMLRSQLGDELYRRCIRTYLERHQYGNVTTDDLNDVVEELSGRSFDQFFDQYVYHAHHPELTVEYSWDERSKLARLSVRQVQKLSENVLLFDVPLPVRFQTPSGPVEHILQVKQAAEDFYLPLDAAPTIVRLDPELTLLAKLNFKPSRAMLLAQLEDRTDMPGRLLAVKQLSGKADALTKLKTVLNEDPFYGVRLAAARSLQAIQTAEALEALLASRDQPDARVRQQVVRSLTGFYRDATYQALYRVLLDEKNPGIQSIALKALGAYGKTAVRPQLIEFLRSTSYRSVLADAAIAGIRAQDDPTLIPPLLEVLRQQETTFPTPVFTRGLRALAWIARDEEDKAAVSDFLLAHLSSAKTKVELAAINALATLGDTSVLGALETLSAAPKESRTQAAAERAVTLLREARKPSADVSTLRNEVRNLQKENRKLRQDLDAIGKKLEALTAREPGSARSSKRR